MVKTSPVNFSKSTVTLFLYSNRLIARNLIWNTFTLESRSKRNRETKSLDISESMDRHGGHVSDDTSCLSRDSRNGIFADRSEGIGRRDDKSRPSLANGRSKHEPRVTVSHDAYVECTIQHVLSGTHVHDMPLTILSSFAARRIAITKSSLISTNWLGKIIPDSSILFANRF